MTTNVTQRIDLKDPHLFREACYVDGAWLQLRETIDVDNPATGEIIGTVPTMSPVAGLSTSIVARVGDSIHAPSM